MHKAGDREGGIVGDADRHRCVIVTARACSARSSPRSMSVWKAKRRRTGSTLSRLVRARLASLGAGGDLRLPADGVAGGECRAAGAVDYLAASFPARELALQVVDFVISIGLMWGMFAAIYKVLPDTPVAWRDVAIGALVDRRPVPGRQVPDRALYRPERRRLLVTARPAR